MATINIQTANGGEFTFENADNLAATFLKNRGQAMPYEISDFGYSNYIDNIRIWADNFSIKYIFNRIVVRITTFRYDDTLDYHIETSIKFNPLTDTWKELKDYEKNINLPFTKCCQTVKQVAEFLAKAFIQKQ